MPYEPHSRLTFSGIFGPASLPLEEWAFRLNMGPWTVQDVTAGLAAARDAFATHLAPRVNSIARLTQVKVASIGADGKYVSDAVVLEADVPGTGTINTSTPLQITQAVTLDTARRGPTGRGRFYLPAPDTGIETQARVFSTTVTQTLADSAAMFISALNAIPEFQDVVIASSKGYLSPVTHVRVGRVPDTMRSRRRSMDEDYVGPVAIA